jgi:gliding motility-associated lipoprotein GldD
MKAMRTSFLLLVLMLVSCGGEPTVPLPKGYMRIGLPAPEYVYQESDCPYRFLMNRSARWEAKEHCWGDIYYPSLRARIQLTYKRPGDELDRILEESFQLAYKHTVRADGISEQFFQHPEHEVYGLLYRLQGEIATSTQFFMTDSAAHYLRGVVYFYAAPNPDSLKPVEDFMAAEVVRLIESLEWKEPV